MKKKIFFVLTFVLLVFMIGCNLLEGPGNDPDSEPLRLLVDYELVTPSPLPQQVVDQILAPLAFLGFDISPVQQLTRYDVSVYRLTYYTVYNGKMVLASGAVILPETREPLPILALLHGTIYPDEQAPSRFTGLGSDIDNSLDLGLPFGSCGYICSAPDYLGYGASNEMVHPFHHAGHTARSSLDMLRATREFCEELGVDYRNEYFLCGYSEGGYATLALQKEIRLNHAAEFPIIASSAGAGAYDLYSTMQHYMNLTHADHAGIICYIFYAYYKLYQGLRNLGEIFRSPCKEQLQSGILNGDFTFVEVFLQLGTDIQEIFTAQFTADFTGNGELIFKNAFMSNNLHTGWSPAAPTRLYHGTLDQVIPFFNSQTAVNTFRQNGSNGVELIAVEGSDHTFTVFPWIIGTLTWFDSLR